MSGQWRLRGYVVDRLLGSGASADVWRGRVASSGDLVALKRIHLTDPAQAGRARQEAALLSALDHPNLIRLHDVVTAEDSLVLVLDLAEGGSLQDLLDVRGRLTPGEVITAVAPVAAAVSYLHSSAVVHGDISAANILFTESGVPLLCDVGVARLTGDDRDAEGTPAYIDPAVASGRVPGPPSDVFSLGAVAFHAVTGSPLFRAATAEATLALASRGVPADLAERLRWADVPDTVAAPILRALAIDPHRRGTAVELALDLRQSAVPLAVELGAGRARIDPTLPDRSVPDPDAASAPDPARDAVRGRHSVSEPGSDPDPGPAADPAPAGRPIFERPGPARAAPGTEPPTRMVGPRPRPAIPSTTPRGYGSRARFGGDRRGLVAVGVFATFAVAVAVALIVLPGHGGSAAATHQRPSVKPESSAEAPPTSLKRAASTRRTTPPKDAASTPRTATRIRTAADWAQALADLDAVRAEAYATRSPELLGRVYVPGSLLSRDRTQLTRLVPEGCGLAGALTTYRVLSASSDGTRSVVRVSAELPPTRLVCEGTVHAQAPASAPARVRIELDDTADGPRISDERPF